MRIKMKNPSIIIYGKISKKTDNVIFVSSKDFENPFYNYDYTNTIVNEIKKIQNSKINDIPVTKLFNYDQVSLWWFLYPKLTEKFFVTISFIDNFLKFIEKEKPKIVVIENDFRNFEIISQVCNLNNIKLKYSNSNYKKFKIMKKIRTHTRKLGANFLTKKKIRLRKNLFYKKKIKIPSLDGSIVFVSPAVYRRHIINPNGSTEKGEYFLQNIIDLLDKKFPVIGVDLIPQLSWDNSALIERLDSKMMWIPVEIFFKKSHKYKKHIKFLKNYNQIVKSNDFQNLFKFKNISYFEQVKQIFREMEFLFYFPYWLTLIDSLNEFLENNKPKTVFLIYETGPYALAFISVCKKFGIKTIGIQHGTIYKHHFLYMHEKFSDSDNNFEFPLPDKILLFGEYFRKLLIERGYPQNKLISFGNPAYLNMDKLQAFIKNTKIYEKYGIEKEKKIILFTTSSQLEGYDLEKNNYETRLWEYLLKNFSNNNKFLLILKPHPRELRATYEKLKKKYNALNAKIIQDNLQALGHISSIIISTYSTATMDLICMNKPVIFVEFDGLKYPVSLGNAVKNCQLSDVFKNINDLLEKESERSELLKNTVKFAKEHYNIPIENPSDILSDLLH